MPPIDDQLYLEITTDALRAFVDEEPGADTFVLVDDPRDERYIAVAHFTAADQANRVLVYHDTHGLIEPDDAAMESARGWAAVQGLEL